MKTRASKIVRNSPLVKWLSKLLIDFFFVAKKQGTKKLLCKFIKSLCDSLIYMAPLEPNHCAQRPLFVLNRGNIVFFPQKKRCYQIMAHEIEVER